MTKKADSVVKATEKKKMVVQRIELLHNYGGEPTNFKRILPGEYDVDDEEIMGLAEYLVKNGHAKYINGVTVVDEAEEPQDEKPADNKQDDGKDKGEPPTPPA